jgi:integrase/recombinase XerD
MNQTYLQSQLEMYLSLRESLGGVPTMHKNALQSFVRYLDEHSGGSNIRAQTAIDWVRGPERRRGACTQFALLSLARGFLTYLKASSPETEIPGRNLIGSWRRPNPYIVPDSELMRVLELVSNRRKRTKNKDAQRWHYTCECIIALIACTGLRIRETINLTIADVQLDVTPPALHICKTKFKKSRWVPLHPTAAAKLREYLQARHASNADASSPFFLSILGEKIRYTHFYRSVRKTLRRAGILKRGEKGFSFQALRHTFAVKRLKSWYETGADARALAPHLSVYMGHVNVAATYWYISSTPDLLVSASTLFESFCSQGDGQ